MDLSETQAFLDSWALDIVNHVTDWDDKDENSEVRNGRRSWNISGSRLVDRVVQGRDGYLNPLFDTRAWADKLNPDVEAVEADLRLENRANEWESRQAVKFLLVLGLVPSPFSLSVREFMITPAFDYLTETNETVFAVTDRQKQLGAKRVREHERRLRFYAGIGQAPPLTAAEMQLHLIEDAVEIAEDFRAENRKKLENVVSDSVFLTSLVFVLLRDSIGTRVFMRASGRLFRGLSDTGKAFLIISVADIICGYHSEEGWEAATNLLCEHYGWAFAENAKGWFVSIVPIFVDTLFKLWLFTGLNRQNPSTVVTIKEMDRH